MAATYFKFPGIPGSSAKPGRSAWIEVLSFTDSTYTPKIEQGKPDPPGLLTPEPAPPPRPDPTRGGVLTVRKELDAASKKLHEAQRGNSNFHTVEVEVVHLDSASQKEVVHAKSAYEEVFIVNVKLVSPSNSSVGRELEEITLTYSRRHGTQTGAADSDAGKETPKQPAQTPTGGTSEQAFLQVPGIPGDVKAPPHTAWIGLLKVNELASEKGGTGRQIFDRFGKPRHVEPVPASDAGTLTVTKRPDSATQKLRAAFDAETHFEQITVDIPRASGMHRLTFKNAMIINFQQRTSPAEPPAQGPQPIVEEITFSYARLERDVLTPPKKPASHPVTRANTTAMTEQSTINLRPPKFFELALPVLSGENGQRIYPPATATVRLTSPRGYDRSYSVSEGMVTDDDFCSFRFYDISEKATDELFTATLAVAGETETIFKDRRIATYIQAARKNGDYETAFAPGSAAQAESSRDELLPPETDTSGQTKE